MKSENIIFMLFLMLITACASVNDSLTAKPKIVTDDFDGQRFVEQGEVSAASSFSETFHQIGLRWTPKAPKTVFLTVSTNNIQNITDLQFNADGNFIDAAPAQDGTSIGQVSRRQFSVSLDDLKLIASSAEVKVKVNSYDGYTLSSFNNIKKNAVITTKFAPFLELVSELSNTN